MMIKRFLSTFLMLYAFTNCTWANSPQWSLNDADAGWNSTDLVQTYYYHSEMQRQWAWELLGKYPFKGDEKILDFGCGDGKISAEVASFLPKGTITGIDLSGEMIRFASHRFPSYAYPNLDFRQNKSLTLLNEVDLGVYDAILSFCVFHVVENPVEVLKNLYSHLKPGGKLFCVIPAGKNPEFFQAANETFAEFGIQAPWMKQADKNVPPMRTLSGCSQILKDAGYNVLSIEMIDTVNPFIDERELLDWMIGTTTANWNIPLDISTQFFQSLINRMKILDPHFIDELGHVHFKLSRIHLVAER